MHLKQILLSLLFIGLTILNTTDAAPPKLKPFTSGSYQHLVAANTGHPFLLAVWSINCPSCLKDMSELSTLHQARPELKIIMLSVDNIADSEQVLTILEKMHLAELENWIYADDNTQKLQFEMDSTWFGELPRTYFFNKTHQREAFSGVLTKESLDVWIKKIIIVNPHK